MIKNERDREPHGKIRRTKKKTCRDGEDVSFHFLEPGGSIILTLSLWYKRVSRHDSFLMYKNHTTPRRQNKQTRDTSHAWKRFKQRPDC